MGIDVSFAEATRAISYAMSAVASMWVSMLFWNEHRKSLAWFFLANALLNIGWLVSLTIVVMGIPDANWRSVMTPLIAINAILLTFAMISRLRKHQSGGVYYHSTKADGGK